MDLDWVGAPGGAIRTSQFVGGAGGDLAVVPPADVALSEAYLARWHPATTVPHAVAEVLLAARAAVHAEPAYEPAPPAAACHG